MARRIFISIGVKLTGVVSLLLAFALSGLTAVSSVYFARDIERTLRANTFERVALLSAQIENLLETRASAGRIIAATLEGNLVTEGSGRAPTAELLAQNPGIRSVWVLSRDSEAPDKFLITARIGEGALRDPEGFISAGGIPERALAGTNCLLNVSPEAGELELLLIVPYQYGSRSQVASLAAMELEPETFASALETRELYVNALVDSDGTLILSANREQNLARPWLGSDPIVRDSASGETDMKQIQFAGSDGADYIGSWKRFYEGELAVISTVRTETALEGVFLLTRRNGYLTVIMLCAAMFVLFFFSRTITVPVRRLMQATIRLGEGDFSVKIRPASNDEVGRLAESFNEMGKGLSDRDKIKAAFGKFVNKDLAERLLSDTIELGGESREAAIFFSDIRSFTAISESLTPHQVVAFLNEYLTLMVGCVNRTHGVVDKFIGDAIMAVWGVPETRGNDAANAIETALEMRRVLAEFNRGRGTPDKPIIGIGCGINTGEVISGQIGSPDRMEYTCIGDAVNLASRVESLNKLFKTDILVTDDALRRAGNAFRSVPMKKIRVKGKTEPQQIHAILGKTDDPAGFKTIEELRAWLGYEAVDLTAVDPDREEKKYEVLDDR